MMLMAMIDVLPRHSAESQRHTDDVPKPGRYRHFKGGEYEVLEIARHSETKELLVLYCPVDDPQTIWARPADIFSGVVESPEGVLPRFQPTARETRRSRGLPTQMTHLLFKRLRHRRGRMMWS